MQKISLYIPSVHSSDTVNFRVPSPDWPHPFLTMLTPKIFNYLSLLICYPCSFIIKTLDISKGHGQLKLLICVAQLLTLIFQNSLVAGIFGNDWEIGNIPIHKKMTIKLFQIKIVSLLPAMVGSKLEVL